MLIRHDLVLSLSLLDVMGLSGTFFVYGGIAVAGVVFIYLLLPETKGKALQDIDRELCERRSDDANNRFFPPAIVQMQKINTFEKN